MSPVMGPYGRRWRSKAVLKSNTISFRDAASPAGFRSKRSSVSSAEPKRLIPAAQWRVLHPKLVFWQKDPNRDLVCYVGCVSDAIRFEVRTKAGLRGNSAGGSWIAESSRNTAVLEALASVLKTNSNQLEVVSGEGERVKLIEWTDPPLDAQDRIDNWRKTK